MTMARIDRSMHGSLRDEVESLRKKVIELQKAKAESDQLRKDFAKVQGEKANLEMEFMKQLNALASENALVIEEYEGRITESEKVNRALGEQLVSSSTPEMVAERIREVEASHTEELVRVTESHKEETSSLRRELEELKQQKETLTSQTVQEISSKQQEVDTLQQTVCELQLAGCSSDQVRDLEAKLHGIEEDNTTIKAQLDCLKDSQASELAALQDTIANQEKELCMCQERLKGSEEKLIGSTSSVDELQKSQESMSRDWAKERGDWNRRREELERENLELKSMCEKLKSEKEQSENERQRVVSENETLRDEKRRLENEKNTGMSEQDEQHQNLRNINKQLQKENRDINASRNNLEGEIRELKSFKETLEQENRELQKLKNEFKDMSGSKISLEKENLELKAALAKLEKQSEMLTSARESPRGSKLPDKWPTQNERPRGAAGNEATIKASPRITIDTNLDTTPTADEPASSYEKRTTLIIRRLEQNFKREGLHKQSLTAGLKFRKQTCESKLEDLVLSNNKEEEESGLLETLKQENNSLSREVNELKQDLEKELKVVEGLRREVSDLRASSLKQPLQSPKTTQIPLYGGPSKSRLRHARAAESDAYQKRDDFQHPSSELATMATSRRQSEPSSVVVVPMRHNSLPPRRRKSRSPRQPDLPISTDYSPTSDGGSDPSPRTPVKGLVQSFERRISNRFPSPKHLHSPPIDQLMAIDTEKASPTMTNSHIEAYVCKRPIPPFQENAVDALNRTIKLDRQQLMDLEEELTRQCSINCSLLKEINALTTEVEKSRLSEASRFEKKCLSDNQEIDRLSSEVSRLRSQISKNDRPKWPPPRQIRKDSVGDEKDIKQLKLQAEDLKRRLSDTEEALKKFQERNMSQQEEIGVLHSQVQSLNKQLDDANTLKRSLAEDIERNSKADQTEIGRLQCKVQTLSSQLLEADAAKGCLKKHQEEYRRLEEEVKAMQDKLEACDEARKLLVQEKAAMHEKLLLANDEVARLETVIEKDLTPQVAGLQTKILEAEETKRTVLTDQEDTKMKLLTEREKVGRLEASLRVLTDKVTDTKENEDLKQHISDLEMKLSEAEETKRLILTEQEDTKMKLLTEGETVARLETRVSELVAKVTESEDNLKSRVAELQAKLSEADETRKVLLVKHEETKMKLLTEHEAVQRLEARVSDLTLKVSEAEERSDRDSGEYARMRLADREEIEGLKIELNANEQEKDKLKFEVDRLQSDLDSLSERRDDELSRKDRERIDELDSLKSTADAKVAAFQKSHNEDKEEIERLRSQVEALREELCDTLEQIEGLKQSIVEKEGVEATVEEMSKETQRSFDSQISRLQLELNRAQEVVMEQANRIEDLEADLVEVRKEAQSELDVLKRGVSTKDAMITQLVKEKDQLVLSMNSMSSSRKNEIEELQVELMEMSTKAAHQTREIASLKQQIVDAGFQQEEVENLRVQVNVLGDQLSEREDLRVQEKTALEVENSELRQRLRVASIDCQAAEEKLRHFVNDKGSSRTVQVLRERNTALKHEVEKLTRKMKKMAAKQKSEEDEPSVGMTRFMI